MGLFTWIIKAVLAGLALRQNLKVLKKTAMTQNAENLSEEEYEANEAVSSGLLMFWCIYGFSELWEMHIEPLVPLITWFPGYWYVKMGILSLAAFPKLQVTP